MSATTGPAYLFFICVLPGVSGWTMTCRCERVLFFSWDSNASSKDTGQANSLTRDVYKIIITFFSATSELCIKSALPQACARTLFLARVCIVGQTRQRLDSTEPVSLAGFLGLFLFNVTIKTVERCSEWVLYAG